ncbi:MAG: ABC transporter permease [Anaerolineaceae bacterium]|nr:ABC transporter permease [Anaerolineaceae bacterium]
MSEETQAIQQDSELGKSKSGSSTFSRVAKYSGARLVSLFITVVIGIFLTIMIANMGGYVDQIMKGQIRENIAMRLANDQNYKEMDPSQRKDYTESLVMLEEKRLGLDQPFVVRSFKFLYNALTLNLGQAQMMSSDKGSRQVREIILERLSPTLLLMGTSNLVLFFTTIIIALSLSRKYGSWVDKVFIALSPTSAMPSWFYGIFLILIFAAVLKVLPFGGMIDSPPPTTRIGYYLNVLKHLILPASSLIISSFFSQVYSWRTFFLIYSSEDYVEMAKAKGLTDGDVQRRYILRPTLPSIVTAFSLMLIGMWTGATITETVFLWPGIGRTIFRAIGLQDTAVIVGTTIIYAYLLALTVFMLDFVYALVDPRVKIGGSGSRS